MCRQSCLGIKQGNNSLYHFGVSLKSNIVILSDNFIVKCMQCKEEYRNYRWLFAEKQTCTLQQTTALAESILNMLVKDMRLLSMVNKEGFQQMIHQFNPEYTLPSRCLSDGGRKMRVVFRLCLS